MTGPDDKRLKAGELEGRESPGVGSKELGDQL